MSFSDSEAPIRRRQTSRVDPYSVRVGTSDKSRVAPMPVLPGNFLGLERGGLEDLQNAFTRFVDDMNDAMLEQLPPNSSDQLDQISTSTISGVENFVYSLVATMPDSNISREQSLSFRNAFEE